MTYRLAPIDRDSVEAMMLAFASGRGPGSFAVVANRRTWAALGFDASGPTPGKHDPHPEWPVRVPVAFAADSLGARYGVRLALTVRFVLGRSTDAPDGYVGVGTLNPDDSVDIRQSLHGSLPA